MVSAAIAGATASLTIGLGVGCTPLPDLTFDAPDGNPNDATLVEGDAGDATSADGTLSPDTGPPDATAPGDAYALDAGDSAGSDTGATDAADARACLPANAPPDAGCCYAVLPCVGLGCGYCSSCIAKACHTNQYCCAQLNGQGVFQGVQCSGDGKNCP